MTDDRILLYDENGEEMAFIPLGRLCLNGKEYALLEDEEDEGSVMVFTVEADGGEDVYSPVEDEDECEEVFYLFQAESDDYEIGPAE